MNPDVFFTIVFAGLVGVLSVIGGLAARYSVKHEREQMKRRHER